MSGSVLRYLLSFPQLQEIFLFHPISSSFVAYIFFLWAHSLSNTQLQSILLSSPFFLSFLICCLRAICWGQIRYPMHATPLPVVVPVQLTLLFLIPCLTFHFFWGYILWFSPISVFIETPSLERLSPKAEDFLYAWDRLSLAGRQPGILKKGKSLLLLIVITIIFVDIIQYYQNTMLTV